MNVLDLIKDTNGGAVVQGQKTRLLYRDGWFEVLAKRDNKPSTPYEIRWYLGLSEQSAVREFLRAEES